MSTIKQHRQLPHVLPRSLALPVLGRGWAVLALLLIVTTLFAWVARNQFSTPAVLPATAPATQFSAARAAQQLQMITQAPRPTGSAANAAVQQYLTDQLAALGLQPEVQTTTARESKPELNSVWAGTVHNIVARIPGTANTTALLLGAHYDSVPSGPGAADCGACVATVLETVRALRAGPALKNDVIVVFQDAEEHDMLGSRAFMDEHPWAADVGFAVNFEAQGSSGAALMYVSSDRNGPLMDAFLAAAPHPLAYSFMTELGGPFGLGMDLSNFMERGAAGLGFAFFGNAPTYHTGADTLAHLSLGSLQHDGSSALALMSAFGNRDLHPDQLNGRNAVFFTLTTGVVAHYPGALVLPLAVVVSVLFGAVLVVGVQRRQLTVGRLAASTGIAFLSFLGAVLLTSVVWWLIHRLDTDLHIIMVGSYQSGLFFLGLAALTTALLAAVAVALRQRLGIRNLTAGALVWWWLLLWLTALALPGFSYLVVWPLVAALLVLGWSVLRPAQVERPWAPLAIGTALLLPALVLVAPAVYVLDVLASRAEGILAVPLVGVPLLVVALVASLLLPLVAAVRGRRGWLMPLSASVVSVVLLGVAIERSGFSNQQPKPNLVAYQLNADTGTAQWLTANESRWSGNRAGALDAWTTQFFTAGTQPTTLALFPSELPTTTFLGYQAPAPVVALPAPEATLLADTVEGDRRTLRVRLTSPRQALNLQVLAQADGRIEAASLNGKPLDLAEMPRGKRDRLTVQYYGMPVEGVELSLTVQTTGPVTLSLADRSYGLPALPGLAMTPRPAAMTPAMTELTDATTVERSFSFTR